MNKSFVKKLAYMYLGGRSLRNIAREVSLSHITVRRYLVDVLPKVDSILASEVHEMLNNNTEKSIKDPEICARVLRSYFALVKAHKTCNEIAADENNRLKEEADIKGIAFSEIHFVNEMTIYRDLTTRLASLHEIAPEKITEEMLNEAKNCLSNNSLANLQYGSLAPVSDQERDESGRFTKK